MKVMGIDFGTKHVGVALSDEGVSFAFPYSVEKNDMGLFGRIRKIIKEEDVHMIVMGESRDYAGNANPIMREIEAFKLRLEKEGSMEVVLEPEFLTSAEAERIQGKHEDLDASAAALILKSYIDKNRNAHLKR